MSVSRVNFVESTAWGTGAGPTYASPSQSITTGNTIVACIGGYATSLQTVTGVTDTAGNTYTKVAHAWQNPGDQYRQEIWIADNVTGHASNVVTATWSAAIDYRAIVVMQYAGLDPAGALDDVQKNESGLTTPTLTGTTDDSAHVIMSRWGVGTTVFPAGFTEFTTPGGAVAEVADKIVTGGAFSGTYTVTTAIAFVIAAIFKAAPVPDGTLDTTLGALTLAATGTVEDPANEGTAALTLGALTLAATGAVEDPAEARLSQTPVEVVIDLTATARLSQTPVEVVMLEDGDTYLSQAIVEILLPAPEPEHPQPTVPLIGSPGIAWCEWRGRVPAALARDAPALLEDTLVTVPYSDWDLQCPPSYYHGFKAARVESFGIAARTLSEARTGDWQGSAMEIHLSDYDRFLRTTLATNPGRFGYDSLVIVRMVSREVRAALGMPLTIFAGPIRRADPVAPLSFALLLEDVVGHGMLADDFLIPQRVIDADDWPDVVVDEAAKGRPVPIIYGEHAREGGAFAPIYLGVENGTDHLWVIAGHYVALTDVFVDGVSVLGQDPANFTIPGLSGAPYEELAGRRYTLLRGRVGVAGAETDPVLYAENAGAGALTAETWVASWPLGGMPPGVDVRWNVMSTTTPHAGAYCMEGIDLREGELVAGYFGLTGAPGTAVPRGYAIADYDNLLIWVLNGTSFWPVGVALEFAFYVGPDGDPIGDPVLVLDGVYGFDETNVTTWQLVTIPIADFGIDPDVRADRLIIRKLEEDEITVSLDDISLDGGPTADPSLADTAAAGRLTVNVLGWTTTGDDDEAGVMLHAIADQYQHFLINYVANPEGYQTGGPLDNPTIDLFDQTVDTVLESSFAAAKAAGAARYPPGGYLGSAILGATAGDRLPVREWIARWNRSADCRFGVSRYGELFIVMTDPTSDDLEAAPLFTETLDTLEGTFQVDVQWDQQATRVPFVADFDYVAGVFRVVRDAEDTALSETYGRPAGIVGTPRQYDFIRDSDQAKNVAEHEVQRVGHPPRIVAFETALGALTVQELGGYIRVRHFAGVGPDTERLCQIEELAIVVDPRHVRVRAVDVTALVDATTPED